MSAPVEAFPTITGVGMALPEQIIDNDALAAAMTGKCYSNDGIIRMVGIHERRWANPGDPYSTSKLAIEAAQGAVAMAGLDIGRLGDIYVATNSPDSISPSMSSKVHGALGAPESSGAIDINGACAGSVLTLRQAVNTMRQEEQAASLVIGAETLSRGLDLDERRTAILFGDGAGGLVLENREGAVRPTFAKVTVPDAEAIYASTETGKVVMNGPRVGGHARYVMPQAARLVAQKAGLADPDNPDATIDWSKIDYFVPHQANLDLMTTAAETLGVPEDKFIASSISKHGNTSAASVFLAIAEAYRQGQIEGGQRTILATAIGAGMVGGAVIMSLDLPKLS